jgi:hypothetical protein
VPLAALEIESQAADMPERVEQPTAFQGANDTDDDVARAFTRNATYRSTPT